MLESLNRKLLAIASGRNRPFWDFRIDLSSKPVLMQIKKSHPEVAEIKNVEIT
jgi:hypothetical protein